MSTLRVFDPLAQADPQAAAMAAAHPMFATPRDRSADGWTMSLDDIFTSLVLTKRNARNRDQATSREMQTHLRRWREFWDWKAIEYSRLNPDYRIESTGKRMLYPLIKMVTREHLIEFRDWLIAKSAENSPLAQSANTEPTKQDAIEPADSQQEESLDLQINVGPRSINKHLNTIRQVMLAAEESGVIDRAPTIEALPCRKAAPKLYFSDDMLNALWKACSVASWPSKDAYLRPLKITPEDWWRAVFTLFVTYGFRTQELLAFESGKAGIAWKNITPPGQTPHPHGQATCIRGWLWYVPGKQRWCKSDPMYLPLSKHAAIAITKLRQAVLECEEHSVVLNIPRNPRSIYATWNSILAASGVVCKHDPSTGLDLSYDLKHFRKTATTRLNQHRPGMAQHIVGHADDRDPTAKVSIVSSQHYDFAENAVCECLDTYPMPSAFDAWL